MDHPSLPCSLNVNPGPKSCENSSPRLTTPSITTRFIVAAVEVLVSARAQIRASARSAVIGPIIREAGGDAERPASGRAFCGRMLVHHIPQQEPARETAMDSIAAIVIGSGAFG